MTWSAIKMQWPEHAASWMAGLDAAKELATSELASTGARLADLQGISTTNPGPVGAAAQEAIEAGRQTLAEQLGQAPACIVVTPFQAGIGQGTGYQRFLSAPNLLDALASKLVDATDSARPQGELHALSILFLSTRFDQLAASLGRFNALIPMPELVRAERRAGHIATLETDKWQMPKAGTQPAWQSLPLERCTVIKAAQQSIAGQIAALESYADSSPLGDLAALATRKAEQQVGRDQQLADLKAMLQDQPSDTSIRARMIGPGSPADLRTALLEPDDMPGHEWVMCAGLLLVGSEKGLSFVRELVGL